MGNRVKQHEGSVRPPRWAEALLRRFLRADEAETESGDLLEAYRDSIHPLRGRWRADLWFMRQVAGYILRARAMSLRNSILAGLMLCVLTIVFSVFRYSDPQAGPNGAGLLIGVAGGFLLFAYVAVRQTRPATPADALILHLGARWGIAIGAAWIIAHICGNLVTPHGLGARIGIVLALVALSLSLVSGAHGALKTGRVRAGMRVGFWSGFISGLMGFLALAAIGYVLAYVPGLPGAEIPATDHIYTAAEFQRLNIFDALGGALAHLFLIGGAFGAIGGTVGGCAGILLVRTRRSPDVSART